MPLDAPLLPLPIFALDEAVCGNCKLWQAHSVEARGWVGPCRLQSSRGMFPPSAPICNAFVGRGTATAPKALVREAPTRAVRNVAPVIKRRLDGNLPVTLDEDFNMTREELMDLFREASGDTADAPLAAKWEGGVIQLVPGKTDLQGKELPIDTFFHKIVMVRDRLRTLEQKLNAHPKLSDAEKVEMQHYITRVYGSLTSFNVLFRDRDDQFAGAKSDE